MCVLFSSDAGQFQLLFLLFPVPFQCLLHFSRGPASKNVFLVSFLLKQKDKLSLFSKKVSQMAKSLAGAHKP